VGLTTTETIVTDARFSSCSDDYNSRSYLRRDWPSNTLMPKQFSPFPPHCLSGADTDLRVAAFAEDLLRDLPAPAYWLRLKSRNAKPNGDVIMPSQRLNNSNDAPAGRQRLSAHRVFKYSIIAIAPDLSPDQSSFHVLSPSVRFLSCPLLESAGNAAVSKR
jgi:hypothetical protein